MTTLSCPECGSSEVIPIVYGMPGPDLIEAEHRGEVVIGGCAILEGYDPTHSCRACGGHFRRPT